MQQTVQTRPFLYLGHTSISPNAHEVLDLRDVYAALQRHESLDWGEVCESDWSTNNDALKQGLRILSAYRDRNDKKFWIVTEADRSVTTVMLPKEY